MQPLDSSPVPSPDLPRRTVTAGDVSGRKAAANLLRNRDFYIVLSLFVLCCLIYYFGELIDFAGWESLSVPFWHGVHDVQRLLFLAPIIYAGHAFRVRGAVVVTIAALAAVLPRALVLSPFPDPLLRTVLFCVFAGVVGTLVAVIRNEVERRTHLEALVRREKDRLLGILERMHDGVMIVDSNYKIRFTNPSMMREFGEAAGSTCYEYLHNFDEPCEGICRLPSVISGETATWEYTQPNDRTYEVIGAPMVDPGGEVLQLGTFRNITQRKQLEQELIELNNLKTELLSNVSHELRSPLTSVKGIISSLLQKDIELDEETKEMLLKGVSEETDRLASLVTKLLDMSKLESGVWRPEKERCYIPDVINEAVEPQKWVHKNHVFKTDLQPDLPDAYADCGQVRQVLTNLLENAAAYSDEGTTIVIAAKSLDGEVQVSVSDQGVGLPRVDLWKIFDKFYRGVQRRQKPGGTGLGLAICKAIIQDNGGRIWVDSEVGQGSTFHFTLPVAARGTE